MARRLARNEARLVRCSAGCGALVWLASALPVAGDATFVCPTCDARALSMADLARKAAEADAAEGGHRIGANIAVLIGWAAGVRRDHGACGSLEVELDESGGATGITCPAHGFLPAPERTRA
jgi:hypothetical protein